MDRGRRRRRARWQSCSPSRADRERLTQRCSSPSTSRDSTSSTSASPPSTASSSPSARRVGYAVTDVAPVVDVRRWSPPPPENGRGRRRARAGRRSGDGRAPPPSRRRPRLRQGVNAPSRDGVAALFAATYPPNTHDGFVFMISMLGTGCRSQPRVRRPWVRSPGHAAISDPRRGHECARIPATRLSDLTYTKGRVTPLEGAKYRGDARGWSRCWRMRPRPPVE